VARDLGQFGEANCGVDVIAQHGFSCLYISGEEAFDAFAQKFLAESRITLDAGSNRFFEIAGQRHCWFPLFLSILVVPPCGDSVVDVVLLPLFRSATEQEDKVLAVFTEVNPITWSEVDPVLVNSRANAFTLE
jgi:hypothetical protein